MEKVLDIYEQPYDPKLPVICFDERPCQLIGDTLMPIPMKPGHSMKQNYEYQRNGTCCVFMAIEPLAGKRIIEVKEQRTKKDYAEFMKQLETQYPQAEKIILVQDNLNTHNPSSFYESYLPTEAFTLSERFIMIHTPKKASRLNMAEIELSALSKQCLDRRIANINTLRAEVKTWTKQRNKNKTTITWSFSKSKARNKLNKFYSALDVN